MPHRAGALAAWQQVILVVYLSTLFFGPHCGLAGFLVTAHCTPRMLGCTQGHVGVCVVQLALLSGPYFHMALENVAYAVAFVAVQL